MEADDLELGWKLIGTSEDNLVRDSFIWIVSRHKVFLETTGDKSSCLSEPVLELFSY